ncbi:MAG TPA: ECF transporter S component [Roseiflexaceae bacterium]|nr:ECF transporter S component [Roseiflexaceae bacterium]
MTQRILSAAIYALSTAIGVAAFLAPFFAPIIQPSAQQQAGAASAPLLLTALVGLCFVALLFEVQGSELNAKSVALLGILVAINAVLRFAEVAVPGPGGFSPIFMLIILTGYVFGGQFGFLMGAMTLLVSGIITGGVGPWLPYQMFAAGWVGLSAPLIQRLGGAGRRLQASGFRGELIALALFGGLWGFAYGAIMNLWFWPYAAGPAQQYWSPGIDLAETLRRYLAFYVLTSLAWDALGAAGNVLLILAFGAPIVRALRRFRDRLGFVYQPDWSGP